VYVVAALVAGGALGAGLLVKRIERNLSGSVAPTLTASARVAAPLDVAEAAYDSKLAVGWEDWGWGSHDLPEKGPAKVVFSGYGGIVLHHSGEMPFRFGALSFRYRAPATWPEFLVVSFKRSGSPDSAFPQIRVRTEHVAKLDGGWREVLIAGSELNPLQLPIDRISIVARSSVPGDPVLLDKIVLTKATGAAAAASGPTRDANLAVLCGAPTQPISPWIYGAAQGDWESAQSVQRIGGNPMSRLNWDIGNVWNQGNDWFFENGKGDTGLWDWLSDAADKHMPTAMTVPMIGWVAKDATSVGFPRSKFGAQRKYDPQRPEAGDGYRADGSPILPGPPTETSVAAPPEVIARWIQTVRDKDRARGARSVQMYILDNEPSLWNVTHRDVHPQPVSYDELLDRTIRYGSAIRKADPDALIAGPAEWGWSGYSFSALDREAGWIRQPDRNSHGGVALIPWYLQKLAEYEKVHGVRLLDVLDVHFYPAAEGMYGEKIRTDAEATALRLRSTRALWDPSYRDESWIKDAVQLIPRMKRWVSANYPGLKVSIGEWSFGADKHVSGGLATVEALGRFGQQGLDSAFYWGGPKKATATFWAFRAFRNFDGKGGHFEDLSLQTREDPEVSLFASRNASGTHLVAIALNRDPVFSVKLRLKLDSCGKLLSQREFVYGPSSSELTELPRAAAGQGAEVELGPYSYAVLDITLEPAAPRVP
jgi:glycosyl hydrolase family 44